MKSVHISCRQGTHLISILPEICAYPYHMGRRISPAEYPQLMRTDFTIFNPSRTNLFRNKHDVFVDAIGKKINSSPSHRDRQNGDELRICSHPSDSICAVRHETIELDGWLRTETVYYQHSHFCLTTSRTERTATSNALPFTIPPLFRQH